MKPNAIVVGTDLTEESLALLAEAERMARALDGHHRGRGRQQRDHDCAVGGRHGRQRERRQEREADDHASGDDNGSWCRSR